MTNPLHPLLAITLTLTAATCIAQPNTLDPESLPRSSFAWNQAEREVGLGNWEKVFSVRQVANGSTVRELPAGEPLKIFDKGGAQEAYLEEFIEQQKIAGLLVLHDGAIRLERYGLNHNPMKHWTSQSVAKSITGTLVGAAIKDGYITSIEDSIADYIPGLRGTAYDDVSIRQLMTMTSGVGWVEAYTGSSSDLARFYSAPIKPGLSATVSYMSQLPKADEPGTTWSYKTGETHLIGELVMAATQQTLADYLSSKIWQPYGMEQPASWHIDRSDHELAGCCFQASLRDYARFGQFVLEGGKINGESIVPDGWFEEATRAHYRGSGGRGYGYQWWITEPGTFSAIGIYGQMIYVDPGRRLVVVTSSAWPEATSRDRSAVTADFLRVVSAEIDGESN